MHSRLKNQPNAATFLMIVVVLSQLLSRNKKLQALTALNSIYSLSSSYGNSFLLQISALVFNENGARAKPASPPPIPIVEEAVLTVTEREIFFKLVLKGNFEKIKDLVSQSTLAEKIAYRNFYDNLKSINKNKYPQIYNFMKSLKFNCKTVNTFVKQARAVGAAVGFFHFHAKLFPMDVAVEIGSHLDYSTTIALSYTCMSAFFLSKSCEKLRKQSITQNSKNLSSAMDHNYDIYTVLSSQKSSC